VAERSGRSGVPARSGLVLTALLVAAVVCNINFAAATVALPDIGVAFDASQTELNLVGLGTGLGLAMSVLYFGALADRYGRKQLLMLGMALTVVSCIVSALAPSVGVLIAARVFTGLAAGMAFPTTLSLITALWAEGPRRTGAIALWSSVGGMASVTGSVIAGALLAVVPWNAVFLLAVPLALLALVLVLVVVPSHVDESTEPVDHAGGILSTVGIAALVLGIGIVLAPGGAGGGLVLLAIAVVVLGAFLLRQRSAANPLYDLTVARRRLFWVPALAGTIAFGSLIGAMFVGEQFMQNVLQYTPLAAGAAVIPAAAGLIVMAPVSARLVSERGTRTTMLVGYVLVLLAFVTMLFWREDTGYWLIGLGFLVIGAGAAFVMTASSRSLTSSTPVRRVGQASATSDLQNDLGGSIMQALLGAVLAAGFAGVFADLVKASPDGAGVTPDVLARLQASFASAAGLAQQPEYAPYADEIMEAARQSLLAGSLGAYLIGGVAILIGFAVVWFGLPSREHEARLREEYAAAS
jgi:MFS family permease